jgi:hypothetical protein
MPGYVKHGAVRKAARKADDAWLAQQLEEFADRRGFYVIESFGKLHTFSWLKRYGNLVAA